MGYAHHPTTPPGDDAVAALAPRLDDRTVHGTVRSAHAYAHARAALLAVSGIALLQQLGRGEPTALAGVAVTAADQLERARYECACTASAEGDLRRRIAAVAAAVEALAAVVGEFRRDPVRPVRTEALEAVRRSLARVDAPRVGVRWSSSVGCAGRLLHPEPAGHAHEHGPAHGHHH